jgi:hypothetical protein
MLVISWLITVKRGKNDYRSTTGDQKQECTEWNKFSALKNLNEIYDNFQHKFYLSCFLIFLVKKTNLEEPYLIHLFSNSVKYWLQVLY